MSTSARWTKRGKAERYSTLSIPDQPLPNTRKYALADLNAAATYYSKYPAAVSQASKLGSLLPDEPAVSFIFGGYAGPKRKHVSLAGSFAGVRAGMKSKMTHPRQAASE